MLQVWSNGEINYTIKDIHSKVTVVWEYQTASGSDAHYSLMRGSKANLIVRQGKEEGYKPVLYIEPVTNDTAFEKVLEQQFAKISARFPGVGLYKTAKGWSVKLPERLAEGHEAHFGRVMENFLDYLKNKNMPAWEVPNMLAKYYTTTKALETALKNK